MRTISISHFFWDTVIGKVSEQMCVEAIAITIAVVWFTGQSASFQPEVRGH